MAIILRLQSCVLCKITSFYLYPKHLSQFPQVFGVHPRPFHLHVWVLAAAQKKVTIGAFFYGVCLNQKYMKRC